MRERVVFLLKAYGVTVVIFILAKVVFMMSCHEATPVLTMGDVKDVLVHGLALDLSTALYSLSVPFLLSMVCIWVTGCWLQRILQGYYLLIAFAFALAFVADTSLYEFWHFKLDATCLQYLEMPTEAMASVSTGYVLVRLLTLILITLGIYLTYWYLTRRSIQRLCKPYAAKMRTKVGVFVALFLFTPLIIIGIRGGVDESTTNIGQVYYSQNQFLNHSAVNPVFSFLASFENTASDAMTYDYYSPEELSQLTQGLYDSESEAGDTLLSTQRPNVVVILLESCGKMFLNVMPHLRQAAAEGIDFTNCYGNSYRTDRGTVCSLSGYMSFPTMSVMKMSNKVGSLSSIARSLQREGYSTDYLYGGDINFTKMKGYLISTGFERLHWKQDYTQEEQSTSKWGVRDDITFRTLSEMVSQHDDGKPFLIG